MNSQKYLIIKLRRIKKKSEMNLMAVILLIRKQSSPLANGFTKNSSTGFTELLNFPEKLT
jgi:hypothetical protein